MCVCTGRLVASTCPVVFLHISVQLNRSVFLVYAGTDIHTPCYLDSVRTMWMYA